MTTAVQHRRGTTAEHSTFTGLEGEVTIDTTKDTAVIHDGALAGGYPLAKETLSNVNPSTLSTIDGASTAADDKLVIYDTSASTMKSITRAELNNAMTLEALDTVDINGGTIDGTTIGASTPSTGAFTTLSSNSTTTLNGTTIPASKTLIVSTDKISALASTTSNELAGVISDETGTGALVFANSPTLVTPALGTPASGVVTNLTGTASININGTVGATTPSTGAFTTLSSNSTTTLGATSATSLNSTPIGATTASTGAFTTLSASSSVTLSGATANGVAYANGSKVLTSGSALTYNGTTLAAVNNASAVSISLSRTSATARDYALGIDGDGGFRLTDSTSSAVLLSFMPSISFLASQGELYFKANNSEQMRLTSTGLGIGTSSPSANLQVNRASQQTSVDNDSQALSLVNTSTDTAGNLSGIRFRQENGTNSANSFIGLLSTGNGATRASLVFAPPNTSGNATEAARIDSSGNVGIGTSSPGAKLQVTDSTSAAATALVRLVGQNNYQTDIQSVTNSDSTVGNRLNFAINSSGGEFSWSNSGGTRLYLNKDGNVGIGTSSPVQKEHLDGGAGDTYLQFSNSTTGATSSDGSRIGIASADNTLRIQNLESASIRFDTAGTERARIDSSGNVGIGTSSPQAKLQVLNTVKISDSTQAQGSLILGDGGSTSFNVGIARWNGSTNAAGAGGLGYFTQGSVNSGGHFWYTGDASAGSTTLRMTLDSSGNLLVGTTSPLNSSALRAANNGIAISPIGQYIASCTSSYCAVFNVNSTNTNQILFQNNGSSVGSITSTGSATTYATSSDYRLKENIQPMTGALAAVAQLSPVTYNWKADGSNGQGFIAHELQAVVPDCVTGEKDAVDADGKPVYQGVDTSFLVATLTAAIKELKAEFDAYKLTHP